MTKRPTPEEVQAQLRTYQGFTKINGRLLRLKDHKQPVTPENACFCIEGVLCHAAVALGLEAKFSPDRDEECFSKNDVVMEFVQTKTPTAAIKVNKTSAPEEVYEFLGLPQRLGLKELQQLGLGEEELKNLRRYADTKKDGQTWFIVNDVTDVSLPDLISLACKLAGNTDSTKQ